MAPVNSFSWTKLPYAKGQGWGAWKIDNLKDIVIVFLSTDMQVLKRIIGIVTGA